jgi:hypothetical protein
VNALSELGWIGDNLEGDRTNWGTIDLEITELLFLIDALDYPLIILIFVGFS